jgi:type IV secretory pathway VirB10-like protein
MKKAIWLILPLILCLNGPVSAEFYKYTDKDGVVRFTDDISKVPEDQRPDITSYEESKSAPAPEPVPDHTPKSVTNAPTTAEQKEILRKNEELNKEYKALMEEGRRLEAERKNATKKKEIEAYNRKVAEHNKKTDQWEQKRKAFNKALDEYNARATNKIKQAK